MVNETQAVRPGHRWFKVSQDYVMMLRMRTRRPVLTVKQAQEIVNPAVECGLPPADALARMNPDDNVISELTLRISHQMPGLIRLWISRGALTEITDTPPPAPAKPVPVPGLVPAPPPPEFKADAPPEEPKQEEKQKPKRGRPRKNKQAAAPRNEE